MSLVDIMSIVFVFFFNDTATTEIYTLSLHDALPIYRGGSCPREKHLAAGRDRHGGHVTRRIRQRPDLHPRQAARPARSEEHTSELQSRQYLVCRLLLEKKKKAINTHTHHLTSPHHTL